MRLKWIKSNTGHHYGPFRLRVITATIDGKGPMYWLYDANRRCPWEGRFDADGQQKFNTYEFGEPVRDLRVAKRLVEKLVATSPADQLKVYATMHNGSQAICTWNF